MLVPEQIYRWLGSLQLVPKQAQLNQRKLVIIPAQSIPLIESGYTFGRIIISILKNNNKNIPSSLNNIRKDDSRNTRLNNWNFIWLSFDDVHLQVDVRIKDLILQGQNALIIQLLKQLYEKDQKKNTQKMKIINLKQKASIKKIEKNIRNAGKGNTLDIKKINTQKNPDDSDSSLQYLILLLTSSLGLNVQEILGLFTNQNKYLAHIIVKGLNDDFGGILVFYTLLNKHSNKLKHFCLNDQNDAYSCLYAIKPGFISRDPQVAQLTLNLFQKLQNIYPWFINQQNKGSHTFLLGIKRHPHLSQSYFDLLLKIIKDQQVSFFSNHFKQCFRDSQEMIEVCNYLVQSFGQNYIKTKLTDSGIIQGWLDIAGNVFDEGNLDSKMISYQFLGKCMLWLSESVKQNQDSLIIFAKEWRKHKLYQFTTLFNELINILQKLAEYKNIFASKLYQTIIQIYVEVNSQRQKQSYIVQNFSILVPHFPKIPTQFFIQTYKSQYLNQSDYYLIQTSIQVNKDPQALQKIGSLILQLFIHDSVVNHYLGPLILQISKKIIDTDIGHKFIKKVIKQLLLNFSQIQTHKKIPQLAKPQPMYFNYKGNSQKLNQQQILIYKIRQKQTINFLQFIDKLANLFKSISNQNLQQDLRQQLLQTNAYVRKNNHKKGNKKLSLILKKLGISKEDVQDYDDQYRNKVQLQEMQNSIARKKQIAKNASLVGQNSRISGPQNLKKQFTQMVKKRKKEQQQKKQIQQKKKKQINAKQNNIKKQIQLTKLMRGYGGGQIQLKQFGFWNKIVKEENKELQIFPPQLLEQKNLQYIENTIKKYHKGIRIIFNQYTSSMHSVKSTIIFEDHHIRKQVINVVQLIKFLKDYKLFHITNNTQIQHIVRDINVKMLNRRQTQQLDFVGFQNFLIQFSLTIFTKYNSKTSNNLFHLPHFQILQELIKHIKIHFKEKGQNISIFQQPQSAYFNETQVVKQFNKKLQKDKNFILPEGYKKVTDKIMDFHPKYSSKATKNVKSSFLDVYKILDQIISQSSLNFHILEPICEKMTKIRAKPHIFANIKPKFMSDTLEGKRSYSSVFDKKASIPPIKILERKVFSFGMKLGLSYINYKDKLIGEQVAYVIDDILTAVQNGKKKIQKQKVVNEIIKKRIQMESIERRVQSQREKKRKDRIVQLQKLKKQATQKKKRDEDEEKIDLDRKKQEQQSKQKRRKQQRQRYLSEQKKRLQQKALKDQFKKKQEKLQLEKKQEDKKQKVNFKQFNNNQIQKFRKSYESKIQHKKKIIEQAEKQKKHKDQMYQKLRSKIRQDDRRIIQIRQKNNQQISQLFKSSQIQDIFKQYQVNLKGIFDFLIKNTYLSITQKKHNNEIIIEKWHYFNYAFQLNPLIIVSKQVHSIFITLTKDKQIRKEYYIGLNYQQFLQGLLRIVIKHKSVFNKLAVKIKQQDMSQKQINAIVQKDIRQKQRNDFDEQDDIDVKGLLLQGDKNKQIIDDYGDISKVNGKTLKALIFYLKVPRQKKRQQQRFRQILSQKLQNKHHNYDKLKQKLKQQYTLSQKKKKPKQVPKEEPPVVQKNKKEEKKGKSKNK